ncbi:MAG TPA: S8/S53 family peptidase [Prolixibacteraceae bacterium]|nr:S8/S53 family peptidase [Prolixibacteraceae bacterium]
MKTYNLPIELIIQMPAHAIHSKSVPLDVVKKLKKAGIDAEMEADHQPASKKQAVTSKSIIPSGNNVTVKTKARDTEINPWDIAHLSAGALGEDASYIEPNFINEFTVERKVADPADQLNAKSFGSGNTGDDYDSDWAPNKNIVWHLDEKHSQLLKARTAFVHDDYEIRIGHLDTGYSKMHFAIPEAIRTNTLQRNFVKGQRPNDAHDPFSDGFLKQPGHGTGTLGLLAGTKVDLATDNGRFQDYLGGAYFANVICCRIAESVILFKTNAFAQALQYLTELSLSGTQVHVVSMSMGGAPSKIWADAVNAAYDAGITMVTASGNNFSGLPTRHVVYPARFKRVIAACGVTYDFKPYYTELLNEMQGCFGPSRHMSHALAAFTPNTPWASVETNTIRFSGAGTSSATPQIAAAAAIYYKKYHNELDRLLPWQRVEAVRNALYHSALKKVNEGENYDDFATYFGNGILQAHSSLSIPVNSRLAKTPKDEVPWFPILNTLFKKVPNQQQRTKLDMLNTEIAQLIYNFPELNLLIDDDLKEYDTIDQRKWQLFKEAVINHPSSSVTLKKYLEVKQ